MELTREVLEAVRNDRCDMPLCSDCIFSVPKGHPDARLVSRLEDVWCSHPGLITVATFALALMDERDRLRDLSVEARLTEIERIADNGERWAALVSLLGKRHAKRYWDGYYLGMDVR